MGRAQVSTPTLFRALFLSFAITILLFAAVTEAQVLTGSIVGSVTDPSGAVVAGATVTAVDRSTNREHRATTGTNGEFVIPNVPFGFYRVTIEAKGFNKQIVNQVQVNVSQAAVVNAKLSVSAVGTEVEVVAEQAVVQTESSELKNSVDRRQIMDLPLPTRNPLDLVRGMAGMASPTNSSDLFVHGLRGNATNITQDGVNVADNFVKTSSFFALSAPTVDTVGEFNVSVGGFGTDGGFGAAQVSIVTNRGSNNLHGSVFWFQRTSYLNANTYFNNAATPKIPRPFQLQNRIGFNLGGPVFVPKIYNGKSKTWFFTAFEAFREPRQQARTRLVMSDSARTGLFTYKRADTGQLNTVNLLNITTITAGSSSITPTINPAVMGFYNKLVPSPNTDAGCQGGDGINLRCFAWNIPGKSLTNRYTARIDHQLNNSHAVEFVYNQLNSNTINDFLNGTEPYFPLSPGGGQASKRQVFTWAFHSVFGQNKTNTARVGITRAPVTFVVADNKFDATGGFQITLPTVQDPQFNSTNLPQGRNTPVRQIIDNFAWVKGHHNLQFGGEYRQVLAKSFFWNVVIPRVTIGSNPANQDGLSSSKFPGGLSQQELTNAQSIFRILTGMLGNVQQGFNHTSPTSGFVPGVPRTITPLQHNFAYYAQDSWKFRPNLTLQYGVRWEYQGVFDLRNKLVLQPDDPIAAVFGPAGPGNLFNPVSTPATNDVLLKFAGGNNGKPLYKRDWNNFAPFLGFAWDPFSDGKTSVRAGFATHYTADGFTIFQLSSTGNNGLFSVVTNSVPTGVFNPSSVPTPAAPPDVFPVSQKANFAASSTANLWVFSKNLATPYVLEWNFGIQREIGNRVTVEARYVGNHAVKQYRSTDYNELNLLNSPFTAGGNSVANILAEFKNAQNNLNICSANRVACTGSATGTLTFANKSLAGQVPLPILETLFKNIAAASGFSSSTFINNLQQNQIGSMFDTLRRSPTYAPNRASFPLNFFVPNPWASQSILIDNSSWSNYNGLELEVRRRFSSGLFFGANYTWSKALTDQRFLTSQQEFQPYRSIANRALDKYRAAFDQTHAVSINFLYPLPIGKGKWIAGNANSLLEKFVGGWNLQGLTRWSTGSPFTIFSGRFTTGVAPGTFATYSGETAVLRNMTPGQLKNYLGVFKTPAGVFFIDPRSGLLNISGTSSTAVLCKPGQTTPCFDHPGAGEMGNLPFLGFDSPMFFNQDLSVVKKTAIPAISENFNFEIRLEAFNVLNHTNFAPPSATSSVSTATITSTRFGQLTSAVDSARGGGVTSRIVQWAVRVNF